MRLFESVRRFGEEHMGGFLLRRTKSSICALHLEGLRFFYMCLNTSDLHCLCRYLMRLPFFHSVNL